MTEPRFKEGDRIIYTGNAELTLGTVKRVQKSGYRIDWDDGYKDLPGRAGVYSESEIEKWPRD